MVGYSEYSLYRAIVSAMTIVYNILLQKWIQAKGRGFPVVSLLYLLYESGFNVLGLTHAALRSLEFSAKSCEELSC
jgi:hypothetical protein